MKETQPKPKDKLENVKQVSIESKTVLIGRVLPKRGHTMFEVNKKLMTVDKATFDELPAVKNEDAKNGTTSIQRKLTIKPDCIYISALNVANVVKILVRDYGLNIDKKHE